MGDLRADIKIKLDMWGNKYSQEFWITYWDDGDGNDERVKSWFRECYQDAYGKYRDKVYKSQAKQRAKDKKEAELAELKRLKDKYE